MTSLTESQFKELKEALLEENRDLYLKSHVSKDKEISGLHREILEKIKVVESNLKNVGDKISSHDEFISKVAKMLPEIEQAIKAYENTGVVAKAVIGFVLGVPALAGCIAGIIYMAGLLSNKQ
jgi:hypothetical protein